MLHSQPTSPQPTHRGAARALGCWAAPHGRSTARRRPARRRRRPGPPSRAPPSTSFARVRRSSGVGFFGLVEKAETAWEAKGPTVSAVGLTRHFWVRLWGGHHVTNQSSKVWVFHGVEMGDHREVSRKGGDRERERESKNERCTWRSWYREVGRQPSHVFTHCREL